MRAVIEQALTRLARALVPRTSRRRYNLRREIDEELLFHLERRTDDLERGGLTHGEAVAAAHRAFGDPEAIRNQCLLARENDPVRRLVVWASSSVRFATGAGLAVAVVVLAWAVIIREPLTFPAGGEWVLVGQSAADPGNYRSATTLEHFDRLRHRADLFDRVTAARYVKGVLTGDGPPVRVQIKEVTSNYFEDHGVGPEAGSLRFLRTGSSVVLSHELFHTRYRGDPSVFGRKVEIDDKLHTIIGAVPESFQMFNDTDLFRPIPIGEIDRLRAQQFLVSARLRPKVSVEAAGRELVREPAGLPGRHTVVRTINSVYSFSVRPRIWLFLAVGGLIGLVVAGSAARGASAERMEGTLATAGGVAILAPMLLALLGPIILGSSDRIFDTGPGLAGWLIFGAGAALTALTLARLGRTRRSSTTALGVSLRVAVSVFAVSLAARPIADQWVEERADSGLSDSVYVATLHLGAAADRASEALDALGMVFEHLDSDPGIESASITSLRPGTQDGLELIPVRAVDTPGAAKTRRAMDSSGAADFPAAAAARSAVLVRVGTDYIRTMDLSMIEGTDFPSIPVESTRSNVIINHALADLLYPDASAVGRWIRVPLSDDPMRIAGVVSDHATSDGRSRHEPAVFVLAWRHFPLTHHVLIRSADSGESVARTLGRAVDAVHPNIAVAPLGRVGDPILEARKAGRSRVTFLLLLVIVSIVLSANAGRRCGERLRVSLASGLILGVVANMFVHLILSDPMSAFLAPDIRVQLFAALLIAGVVGVSYIASRNSHQFRLLTSS